MNATELSSAAPWRRCSTHGSNGPSPIGVPTLDLSTLRLVKPLIPVFAATGFVGHYGRKQVEYWITEGRVAKITRRGTGTNGAIRRLDLLAIPGEIARRSSQSTVIKVLPTTYTHRDSLAKGL